MQQWLVFVGLSAVFGGIAVGSPPSVPLPVPPAPERKSGVEDPAAERARLQAELRLLLGRIGNTPPAPTGPNNLGAPGHGGPKTNEQSSIGVTGSLDPIREGTNLFRSGDFESATRTFRLIDPTALGREDRAFVRYMYACSLRRQNKVDDAEVVYREVANSTDDEFLSGCAIWQLSLINADKDLQAQLGQLRSRAKSK